ncbi:MAG: hypothetical protein RL095_1665 [Verrucomicrobiota bacterium]|jgi:CheY-like chemotaxis protein/nitrogen-specific signal transduction histidine kinase
MAIENDITTRRQSEEELRIAKQRAEQASAAKSAFIATMSHELRTPLNAVIGYSNLIRQESELTPRQNEELGYIQQAGQTLLEIVNDILDLSKIEADRLELSPVPVLLDQLISLAISTVASFATQKNLDLKLVDSGGLARWVLVDGLRLRQVLVNLLNNALKFTEHGSVTLTCSHDGEYFHASVTDTGIGISADDLSRLFTPFTQASAETTRRYGGTGLGLSICRRLLQLMGGDVTVVSSPGAGSVFRFHIFAPITQQIIHESPLELLPSLAGHKVLLVEDNPVNQRLVLRLLDKAGLVCRVADDGRAGVSSCLEWLPDVVLMDIQMPVMDGFAATADLRRQGWMGPIIGLSAGAFEEDRGKALASGFDDYLTKPLRSDLLLRRLAHWIHGRV